MLEVVDHWLVKAQDGVLTAYDISSGKAYRSGISGSVETALDKSPGISTAFEFVKQEHGGYALEVKRKNTSGVELKPLQISLESEEEASAVSVFRQLVDRINTGEAVIAETKQSLADTQEALNLMGAEKAAMQASAVKTISAVIAERNKIISERKP